MPSLLIDIGANIARMQQDINKAQRQVDTFAGGVKNAAATMKSALGALGVGLGIHQVTSFFKQTLDSADAMAKLSRSVGVTVEELTAYKHAADLSGVSIEVVGKAMSDLSRRMLDMSLGTGEGRVAFEALGISVQDSHGKLRDTNDVLLEVADRFAGMKDGADKAALAQKLFGESGTRLVTFLNQGSEGLEQLTEEARNLGQVISTETAQQAELLNDNLDRLKKSFTGIANEIMAATVPALAAATEGMLHLMDDTERATLEKQQARIIEELNAVEGMIEEADRRQGNVVTRTLDRVFGGREDWDERKRQLEADLAEVRGKMRELGVIGAGGTTTKPLGLPAPAPGKTDKELAAELKARLAEVEATEAAYEARKMGREYTNYQKIQELEDKALAERMKDYRKVAEEEDAIWNAQVKEYKKATKEMSQTTKDFAENSKWTLSEVFFDAMGNDLKSFGDYWESFWTRMKNSLARTFADMTVNWGMQGLQNILFGTGGGGGGGLLGGALGAIGGAVGGAASGAISSVGSWIASLFHEGGVVGMGGPTSALKAGEILSILQLGEAVMTKDQVKALQGALGGSTQAVNAFLTGGTGGLPGTSGIAPGESFAPGFNLDFSDVFGFTDKGGWKGFAQNVSAFLGMASPKGVVTSIVQALVEAFTSPLSLHEQALIASHGWGISGSSGELGNLGSGYSVTGDFGGYEGAMGAAAAAASAGGAFGLGGFGTYATGGIVPRDQVAKVHKGEGVFTPEQMDRLAVRRGGDNVTMTINLVLDNNIVATYEGLYESSKRKLFTLHQRAVEGYTSTVGLDV